MYLRLAALHRDARSGQRRGVLRSAGALFATLDLLREEQDELDEICNWFNRHLKVPRIRVPQAIFWFKPDARACLDRAWQLAWCLRRHQVHVDLIRTRRPGRVVYEDHQQVAAIPWTDTHWHR